MNSQYIIVYNKVSEKYGLPSSFLTKQECEIIVTAGLLQHTNETDSDTGGTWDHAVSGRKSVIN